MLNAVRDNAHHPWQPPVGGAAAALDHDVIHDLDITVALRIDRRVPEDRVRLLLEHVTARTLKFFDLDWSFGAGAPLTVAAQDLLLVADGRKLPRGRLHGEACDRYSGEALQ